MTIGSQEALDAIDKIQKEMNKTRRVKWKKRKVFVPTCPNCKEQLQGDNSMAYPYKCKCGKWISSWQNPTEFRIEVESADEQIAICSRSDMSTE